MTLRTVDVVVVSYNSRDRLRSCVTPLVGADGVQVIVVDNASPDRSLDAMDDLPVVRIPLAENMGFARACNIGWHAGSGHYVLFLNPDARVSARTLALMADVLEHRVEAGAVAPRILNEQGGLDFSLRRYPRLRSTWAQAFFLHRVFPRASWSDEVIRDEDAYGVPGSTEWASGACLLVRRSALERLAGLDESFFLYCEDTDLCLRLRNLGYDVRYDPSAVVSHEGGASAPRSSLLPVLAESRIRFARKHRGRLFSSLERLGVAAGALTHLVAGRGDKATRRGHARALLIALSRRTAGAAGRQTAR